VCTSAKYTCIFALVFVALILIGIFVRGSGSGAAQHPWIGVLQDSYKGT
jgi:heme A synthase